MEVLTTGLRYGISLLAVATPLVLYRRLWPNRGEGTARPLLVVATATALGAITYLLFAPSLGLVHATGLFDEGGQTSLWVLAGATTTVWTASAWVVFTVRYTGRSRRLVTWLTACVIALSLAPVGLLLLSPISESAVPLFQAFSVLYLVTGLLVTAGILLLTWTSHGRNAFPQGQSLLLSLGSLGLLTGVFVAQLFQHPLLFPLFLSGGSVALYAAVRRYPTFETIPAAREAGRDRVIEQMQEAVIVVEDDGSIHDANPAAESIFDVDVNAASQSTITDVLGQPVDPEALVTDATPMRFDADDGRTIEIVGNRITPHGDRPVGYVFLCEDVTDRRVRVQRLRLLSRFLVEVVPERMETIASEATTVSRGPHDGTSPAKTGERIWTEATTVANLVARTRAYEDALEAATVTESRGADLRSMVDEAVADLPSTADVELSIPADDEYPIAIPEKVVNGVLNDVLETCVERGSGDVSVTIDDASSATVSLRVRVTDFTRGPDEGSTTLAGLAPARLVLEVWNGTLTVTQSTENDLAVGITLPVVTGDAGLAPASEEAAGPMEDGTGPAPSRANGSRASRDGEKR